MKTVFLSLILVSLISGCVVPPTHVKPVIVQVPVIVPAEPVVEYPQFESAYVWDPATVTFYFTYSSKRYYMEKGWHPVYGYPKGQYKRH